MLLFCIWRCVRDLRGIWILWWRARLKRCTESFAQDSWFSEESKFPPSATTTSIFLFTYSPCLYFIPFWPQKGVGPWQVNQANSRNLMTFAMHCVCSVALRRERMFYHTTFQAFFTWCSLCYCSNFFPTFFLVKLEMLNATGNEVKSFFFFKPSRSSIIESFFWVCFVNLHKAKRNENKSRMFPRCTDVQTLFSVLSSKDFSPSLWEKKKKKKKKKKTCGTILNWWFWFLPIHQAQSHNWTAH